MSELSRMFLDWLRSLTPGQVVALFTLGMMGVAIAAALVVDAAYQQSRRP